MFMTASVLVRLQSMEAGDSTLRTRAEGRALIGVADLNS